jgi:cyclic-di-AMP phosphodiesterase PgpH
VITVVAVQGALPFLETLFRLPTVTALLDLADRNHPLLRELEAKALGSYNHSVMVASLTERACREVGANPLLGGVAALYHDIGKVRQPHYFIENQQGIANPHDELEPIVSAIIIQNHVIDGVEMALEHRLPPEVVECIRTHHGTMVVSYFYDLAVQRAREGEVVDQERSATRAAGRGPRRRRSSCWPTARRRRPERWRCTAGRSHARRSRRRWTRCSRSASPTGSSTRRT